MAVHVLFLWELDDSHGLFVSFVTGDAVGGQVVVEGGEGDGEHADFGKQYGL